MATKPWSAERRAAWEAKRSDPVYLAEWKERHRLAMQFGAADRMPKACSMHAWERAMAGRRFGDARARDGGGRAARQPETIAAVSNMGWAG